MGGLKACRAPLAGGLVAAMLAANLVSLPVVRAATASLDLPAVSPRTLPTCAPDTSYVGGDVILTFDDTVAGGCTWTVPSLVSSVRVLVVAGGGGGGYGWSGSGGGAGGMQEVLSYSVTPGQTVAVTVGQGGAGGTGHDDTTAAKSGGNSVFGPIVSAGGGGGSDYRTPCVGARDGGSGGGGTGWGYPVGDPQYCRAGLGAVKSWPDAIDDTQGSRGSHYSTAYGGGGGGGAGGQPTGAPVDGEGWNGGVGRPSTITGTSTLYAGGGGGGGGWYSASNVPGNGGAGGGGKGAHVCCGDAGYAAIAGTDALGGGGGGGSGARPGARGGSGVVIVRFPRPQQSITVAASPNPIRPALQTTLSASGYLGTGAISYAVVSGADNCAISGTTLTAVGAGTCQVTATIDPDSTYLGATSAPVTVMFLPPDCNPSVSAAGSDTVLTFDDTRARGCTWTPPAWVTSVRLLIVAGGGGGGVNGRGGGGGGGVQELPSYSVGPGLPLIVTVGRGGEGAYYHASMGEPTNGQFVHTVSATNGGSSSFGDLVSLGGGFGSGSYGAEGVLNAGSGGTGGGSTGATAGTGTAGQGFDGAGSSSGGGGGGAGGPGVHGDGGAAFWSDITGPNQAYGGGGGAGVCCSFYHAGTPGPTGGWGGTRFVVAQHGMNGRGGGGGGGGYALFSHDGGGRVISPNWPFDRWSSNDPSLGGNGGSGAVIVRYPSRTAQGITAHSSSLTLVEGRTATLSASGFLGTGAITYFRSSQDSGVCTVTGSSLIAVAPGTCRVWATIAFDGTYADATSAEIVITVTPRLAQTIAVLANPQPALVGGTAALSASGHLGTGTITFALAAGAGTCSVSGSTLTALQVGTCAVTASIASDDTYLAATSAPLAVEVVRNPQVINASATPNPLVELRRATLSATGHSGTGAISYAVTSGASNCSVTGSVLHALQPGTCTVTATIAQDSTFAPATSAPVTVEVLSRASQGIAVSASPNPIRALGSTRLSASGFLGTGSVTFAVAAGGTGSCRVAGNLLTSRSWGTCNVVAKIAADDTHLEATSAPLAVTMQPIEPGPPVGLRAEPGNGRVSLRWFPPDDLGLPGIEEFRVFASPGARQVCTVPYSSFTWHSCAVTGLSNGSEYAFWVQAVNLAGPSTDSSPVRATPRPDLPAPPAFTDVIGGNRQGLLKWTASISDGGSPVTEYRVYGGLSSDPVGWKPRCTVPASATYSCLIPDLTNGREYMFYVTAVNSAGESKRSEYAEFVPNPVPPGKPRNPVATESWGTVTVTWDAPDDSGTFPITEYEVLLDWSLRTRPTRVKWGEPTKAVFPGQSPGSYFTPLVRARSAAGWGPYASVRGSVFVPKPPDPSFGYPQVRRDPTDPDMVIVTGSTVGIKPGTDLWVWINRGNPDDVSGWASSKQGAARPVVLEDGTFVWQRRARMNSIWEVIWCTGPVKSGTCSPWTTLVDPTM